MEVQAGNCYRLKRISDGKEVDMEVSLINATSILLIDLESKRKGWVPKIDFDNTYEILEELTGVKEEAVPETKKVEEAPTSEGGEELKSEEEGNVPDPVASVDTAEEKPTAPGNEGDPNAEAGGYTPASEATTVKEEAPVENATDNKGDLEPSAAISADSGTGSASEEE